MRFRPPGFYVLLGCQTWVKVFLVRYLVLSRLCALLLRFNVPVMVLSLVVSSFRVRVSPQVWCLALLMLWSVELAMDAAAVTLSVLLAVLLLLLATEQLVQPVVYRCTSVRLCWHTFLKLPWLPNGLLTLPWLTHMWGSMFLRVSSLLAQPRLPLNESFPVPPLVMQLVRVVLYSVLCALLLGAEFPRLVPYLEMWLTHSRFMCT